MFHLPITSVEFSKYVYKLMANEVRDKVDGSLKNEHCVALLELLVRRQGE